MKFDQTMLAYYKKALKNYELNHKFDGYTKKILVPTVIKAAKTYQAVENATGVPKGFVAALHVREHTMDVGKFHSNIANGQPWNKKTTIVPKGRGPFKSFVEAANDIFTLKGLNKVEWSLERALYEWEAWNGFGYFERHIYTPYVWNGTSLYTRGRYVSDGKWSAKSVDQNIGTFALYKMLVAADKTWDFTTSKK